MFCLCCCGSAKCCCTFSQVNHAILAADGGLDFHVEAHFFPDELFSQELSGLEGPWLQNRNESRSQRIQVEKVLQQMLTKQTIIFKFSWKTFYILAFSRKKILEKQTSQVFYIGLALSSTATVEADPNTISLNVKFYSIFCEF